MESGEDFPLNGGGRSLIKRDWFIKKTASFMLTKGVDIPHYLSYYWRAPVGSGKTTFLKLLGRELQQQGCDVRTLLAGQLEKMDDGYVTKLAKSAGDTVVAILVDEVQTNLKTYKWNELLKSDPPPNNLLVIGVGVAQLVGTSPQFMIKSPKLGDPFPMFLTAEDLTEVVSLFVEKTGHPEALVKDVCTRLLEYTAGHLFPFVSFVDHVLNPSNQVDSADLDTYLISEKFFSSAIRERVRERCFDFLGSSEDLELAENLLLGKGTAAGSYLLSKIGVWHRNKFVSPLLYCEIFRWALGSPVRSQGTTITLDDSAQKVPYVEQIICAGLRDMAEEDFRDPHFDKIPVENSIGFRWGFNVQSVVSNVWLAPQVRTLFSDHKGPGSKPLIDFCFNGRLNMGVELALNVDNAGVQEHLARFEKNYKRYKSNGFIFHILTERETPVVSMKAPYDTLEAKNRVYTFIKKKNALFRGEVLIRENVVKSLSSPPSRAYSTLGLKSMLKFVRK